MARILILDDEPENLEALKRALGDENPDWTILTALNEKEGMDILRRQVEHGETIDVVLTDLVMGPDEAGGMSVLEHVRRLDPLVMTILFTAKEKSLNRYAAFDYGAFDVVEKNIRGASAVREINIKTRAALRYREWSQQIMFLRRYFDPRVFETIQSDPALLDLSLKTITIVFWDVRGFSSLCESLKAHPSMISGFLQEYCEICARVIFEHNGVLDKFIGDGIMALFGVLNGTKDEGKSEAISAVKAAVQVKTLFDNLLQKWTEQWKLYIPDKIDIGLGCGIHTGEALVGNVGTDFRDQFTALGPHVNFTSRIEGRAERGEILVSQSTECRVKSDFRLIEKGTIDDVKNIPGSFPLFGVVI